MEIRIDMQTMLELPMAWQKAIAKYKQIKDGAEDCGDWYNPSDDCSFDIWDAKIELKSIYFEDNYRRDNFAAVFEITEGKFYYSKKPNQQQAEPMERKK